MCSSHETPSTSDQRAAATSATDGGRAYAVNGMTCDHCAMSVTEEVEQVPGVTGIDVDLQTGRVVVRGDGFSDEAIQDAVDEAGYEVVSS